MDANEYQRLAMRTAGSAFDPDEEHGLMLAALGLTGEAGEFADTIKKWKFHGHELDRVHLIKELGDVLWYVARACTALDINMSSAMEENINKLKRRYPDGFSSEASINREHADDATT